MPVLAAGGCGAASHANIAFLGGLNHITYNLPAYQEAPKHWEAVSGVLK
jgi:hypothetical protein